MKRIIVTLLLILSVPAMADVSTQGLSDQQKAQLAAQAAQMKADNASAPISGDIIQEVITNPDAVNKYAQIGEAIAKSIGAAARELNVEVNKFSESGVGKLVMVMTVYHFFGSEILTFIVGFFFMIPMSIWIIYRMNKMIKTKEIIYDDKGKEIGRKYYSSDEAAHSSRDGMSSNGAQTLVTCIGFILVVIQAFYYLP